MPRHPQVLLELVQYCPQERWFHEITLSALHVLHLATLAPHTRRLIVGCMLANQRPGMAVLLWAATPPASAFLNHDPERCEGAVWVWCVGVQEAGTPPTSFLIQIQWHGGGVWVWEMGAQEATRLFLHTYMFFLSKVLVCPQKRCVHALAKPVL
eukprot:350815-Chlamydomonas_euryale.AAC.1